MMWELAGKSLQSRLWLGTAQYPSIEVMQQSIRAAKSDVVTVSLQRQGPEQKSGQTFWDLLKKTGCHILPNTAGCRSAKEAITMAQMAREIFATPWVKLEVIGDDYNLQPDPFELLVAAKELVQQGFVVLPYCTEDFVLCQRLLSVGCAAVMPWAAPIGSGLGLINLHALVTLRARLPEATIIIDAGIGTPSQAAQVMELGFDGVLLNSAIALAADPVIMAQAFAQATQAGRLAFEGGLMPKRDRARPSTPLIDTPFWHQVGSDS